MKISASLYSNKQTALEDLVRELDAHKVDYFHIDCNDDPRVFDDIARIRRISRTPIDLHIISPRPERFFDDIARHAVEYVFFQYEPAPDMPPPPALEGTSYGLAIVSDTPVEAYAAAEAWSERLLFMTTTPGQSGGVFRKDNFQRIRRFRELFPGVKVHVDGGVNHEVSFILRSMGVNAVVSGSFLVNNPSIGAAMLDLRANEVESRYLVRDFMIERRELPVLPLGQATFAQVLRAIEDFRMGLVFFERPDGLFAGLASNADVRRGLLRNLHDLNATRPEHVLNPAPVSIDQDSTIEQMLRLVKSKTFPINFLPVTTADGRLAGALIFNQLIRGES